MAKKNTSKRKSLNKPLSDGVSVILPTYKGEKWILKCLSSLAEQTLDRKLFEVIIIINGEQDNSETLIDEFKNNNIDLNIIKLVFKSSGVSNARNEGIKKSSYKYTTFIDDDDWVSENYLEALYQHAHENTIVFGQLIDVNEEGVQRPNNPALKEIMEESKNKIPSYHNLKRFIMMTQGKLFFTKYAKSISFDVTLESGEDIVYFTTLFISYPLRIKIIPIQQHVYYFRNLRVQSVSQKEMSYDFNILGRLKVIKSLSLLLSVTHIQDKIFFIKSMIDEHIGFMHAYLDENKDDYDKVLMEVNKYNLTYFPHYLLGQEKVSRLIFSYLFAPYLDLSALETSKYIYKYGEVVDIAYSNGRKFIAEDHIFNRLINRFVDKRIEVSTPYSYDQWDNIELFCNEILTKINENSLKDYTEIYSCTSWPGSHFAAYSYKHKHKNIKWIVEFSDSMLFDDMGKERISKITSPWLFNEITALLTQKQLPIPETRNLFFWCEYLAYCFADKIIFSNKKQFEYMIKMFPVEEIKEHLLRKVSFSEEEIMMSDLDNENSRHVDFYKEQNDYMESYVIKKSLCRIEHEFIDKITKLQIEVGEVKTKLNSANQKYREATTKISLQNKELKEAFHKRGILSSDLSVAYEQNDTQSSELGIAHAQIDTQRTELGIAHAQIDTQCTELEMAHAQIDAQCTELKTAHAQIDTQQTELETVYTQNDKQCTELETIHAQVDLQNIEFKTLNDRVEKQSTEFEIAHTKVKELQFKIKIIDHEKNKFEKELENYRNSVSYKVGYLLVNDTRSIGDIFKLVSKLKKIKEEHLSKNISDVSKNKDITKIESDKALSNKQQPVENVNNPEEYLSVLGWEEAIDEKKPIIMGVFDEFTHTCFQYQFNLIEPRPDNWKGLLNKYSPVLLFIESTWKGNKGSWQYRVAKYANPPGNELEELVKECKLRGIPTIFWNKEDPVHFDNFKHISKWFDFIYTSADEAIQDYKLLTKAEVNVLQFAAEEHIHNPLESSKRNNAICFAGSYYANRFSERREDQLMLLRSAKAFNLEIFDRNYSKDKSSKSDFAFPEEFDPFVIGSLPYAELVKNYTKYKVFLNVNSIINSKTMFSRRVFELLACGTPVVSTEALGIEETFGKDIVWEVKNEYEAKIALETLMNDPQEWRKRSLKGIRAVFNNHTYTHRSNQIFKDVFHENIEQEKKYLLISIVNTEEELKYFNQFLERQQLVDSLNLNVYVISCNIKLFDQSPDIIKIHYVNENCIEKDEIKKLLDKINPNYFSIFSSSSIYGKFFINDAVIALGYSNALFYAKAKSLKDIYDYTKNIFSNSLVCNCLKLKNAEGTLNKALEFMLKGENSFKKEDIYVADSANFYNSDALLSADEYENLIKKIEV